ncbi:MAG: alpha/beta hydrolase [Marinicaulis sp.]|nr:alpha/beta hydrolase [Marinicaulis sp.]
MSDAAPPKYLDGPNGRLAYRYRAGDVSKPCVVWFGGLKSDMLGTKAEFLDEWASKTNTGFLRFDYSGHGESDGAFEDGVIGDWAADALSVIDAVAPGNCVFIGSSMGAWASTIVALKRPNILYSAIFIAPAPDFTERLLLPSLSDKERRDLAQIGRVERSSEYEEGPEIFTKKLFDDGRANLVMNGMVNIECPVQIFHGLRDDVVPWRHAVDFAEQITSENVEISLIKAADHRLSTPGDLERLAKAVNVSVNY